MSKSRLCLHDFDHAQAVAERLQKKLRDTIDNRPGVDLGDCYLSQALGLIDAARMALAKSREIAGTVL